MVHPSIHPSAGPTATHLDKGRLRLPMQTHAACRCSTTSPEVYYYAYVEIRSRSTTRSSGPRSIHYIDHVDPLKSNPIICIISQTVNKSMRRFVKNLAQILRTSTHLIEQEDFASVRKEWAVPGQLSFVKTERPAKLPKNS